MLTRLLYNHTKFSSKPMTIKGRRFSMLLADSFSKKAIGLMYREKISPNQGMLFDFPYERRWKIWMLNMRFAIDTIWLDADARIVGIEKNMQPCRSIFSCEEYASSKPAKYVVELKAGTASRLKIKMGDKLW